jgi:hypothetical protein
MIYEQQFAHRILVVGTQDNNGVRCANDKYLLVSCAEQSHTPFYAVESCIGTQDTSPTSEDCHTGYLEFGNEHTIYTVLSSGYQIGIRC